MSEWLIVESLYQKHSTLISYQLLSYGWVVDWLQLA